MAKRKSRRKRSHYVNPLTGEKEYLPRKGEFKDPLTGKIGKFSNDSFSHKSNSRRHSRPMTRNEQEALAKAMIVALILFVLYMVIKWITEHIWESVLISIVLIGGSIYLIWRFPKLKNLFTKKFKIYGQTKDEEIRSLVSVIRSINTQDVRSEEDFEKQLYQRLDAKDYQVRRQVKKGGSRKIDLVINEKIGVELKVADRSKNIQDLIGQATIYQKYFKKLIIVILDTGKVELDKYITLIENVNPEKITTVVVKGDIRRYKKKREYITVEKRTSRY